MAPVDNYIGFIAFLASSLAFRAHHEALRHAPGTGFHLSGGLWQFLTDQLKPPVRHSAPVGSSEVQEGLSHVSAQLVALID